MAKKPKISSKNAPRPSRKEPYTPERMKSVVEKLREQSARLAGITRGMQDAGVKEVVVDGHAMLLRGFNQIDNFLDNLSRAIREEKLRQERV
jgi:hypothetical protein